MDINQVLDQNSVKVRQLLRKHHVIGEPNMDSIRRGFDKHGSRFMLKLLGIITPPESRFSAQMSAFSYDPLADPLSDETWAAVEKENTPVASQGKFWSFWDNLLGKIGQTGEAIGQFQTDAAGQPTQTPEQLAIAAANTRTLYMVAAGFVALLIIILIVKK
jgi:hypothetical protein